MDSLGEHHILARARLASGADIQRTVSFETIDLLAPDELPTVFPVLAGGARNREMPGQAGGKELSCPSRCLAMMPVLQGLPMRIAHEMKASAIAVLLERRVLTS